MSASWSNDKMADVANPHTVEIQIDKSQPKWKLWVNIDGVCKLRVYGINPDTWTVKIIGDNLEC